MGKFTVRETVNAAFGDWQRQDPISTNSTNEATHVISGMPKTLGLFCSKEMYYTWTNATLTASCQAATDLKLQSNVLVFHDIPWQVGGAANPTPVLHVLSTTAGTGTCRIVAV